MRRVNNHEAWVDRGEDGKVRVEGGVDGERQEEEADSSLFLCNSLGPPPLGSWRSRPSSHGAHRDIVRVALEGKRIVRRSTGRVAHKVGDKDRAV